MLNQQLDSSSSSEEMRTKKIFCPFNSGCPISLLRCDYKLHYCEKKLNNEECDERECLFEHYCYFGKSCKYFPINKCYLKHLKKPKKEKIGGNIEEFNEENCEYCDKDFKCEFGIHCTYPHHLDYFLECFREFKINRKKEKSETCGLFENKANLKQCRGFRCNEDHSHPMFDKIYVITEKYQNILESLRPFKKYYRESDLNKSKESKSRTIFCKNGIRCRLLLCNFAHTIEEHVQRIIFHALLAMKFEIAEFLRSCGVTSSDIKIFLNGYGKQANFGMKSFEEHEEFYKRSIKAITALVKGLGATEFSENPIHEKNDSSLNKINTPKMNEAKILTQQIDIIESNVIMMMLILENKVDPKGRSGTLSNEAISSELEKVYKIKDNVKDLLRDLKKSIIDELPSF